MPGRARQLDTRQALHLRRQLTLEQDLADWSRLRRSRTGALALLLNHLLEHALAAHQSHFRHSQTVREALRALPSNSPVVPPLREITGYVERVRFGGHSVSEPVFQRLLESGRDLLRRARPGGSK